MIKYLIISLLWLLSIVNSFSQSNSSLVAFVTDKDSGLPISSASVIIKEAGWATKTTGNDGKAFFDKSMPIGEIHYIISKEGYQGIEGTFNITTEEKSNTLHVKLSKFRDDRLLITGEIVDENDRDLEGALVEVKVADIVRTAKTDASGNYYIELLLNKSQYDVSSLKLEAKCANGTGKKAETIDLTRRNVIYKDFKINCGVKVTSLPFLPPVATFKKDNLQFDLIDCKQIGQKIECNFLLTCEGKDIQFTLFAGDRSSRILDAASGNEYFSNEINVADKFNGRRIDKSIIAGFPVKAKIVFASVASKVDVISKLELKSGISGQWFTAEFRNIQVTH